MREIKFRAWDGDKMCYLDHLWNNHWYSTPDERVKKGYPVYNNTNSSIGSIPKKCFALMQFTGLKDKNGKDIYDGDIMNLSGRNWVVKQLYGGAWALDYANGAGEQYLHPLNKHYEVIGNIYKNPKLLKS